MLKNNVVPHARYIQRYSAEITTHKTARLPTVTVETTGRPMCVWAVLTRTSHQVMSWTSRPTSPALDVHGHTHHPPIMLC